MKKRWILLVPAALIAAPLAGWVGVVNYDEYRARRTILELRVPAGFSGWITIKHDVPGAPALPVIAGAQVFRIPPTGYLETSSPMVRTSHTRKYFRSERGGAVLVAWDPPPSFLREGHTQKCTLIYVPASPLSPDQDTPVSPEHGCN